MLEKDPVKPFKNKKIQILFYMRTILGYNCPARGQHGKNF
jgi:hypothetical protein